MVQGKALVGGVDGKIWVQIGVVNMGHAELHRQLLQFAVAVGDADGTDMIAFAEDELEDLYPIAVDPFRMGDHFHIFPRQRDACGDQFRRAFDFDQAQPTGAALGQTIQVAECRDIDPVLPGNGENGFILAGADILIVDFESQNTGRFNLAIKGPASRVRRGCHTASLAAAILQALAGQQ